VQGDRNRSSRARNLTLAGIAGLVGFVTVILVVGALLLGLWLDAQVGARGPLTIILVILSIPVSLGVMLFLTLRMARAIRPPGPGEHE
jgi:hypothetical protein